VAQSTAARTTEFNGKIIDEFRANEGRVTGPLAGTRLILIHHIGVKSGIERVTPLACTSKPDGSYVIVASNGGSPTHPSWYHNLKAHPRIEVEVGSQTFIALATELDDGAHAELWPKLVAAAPSLREYETKTTRHIPVFVPTREGS